MKALAIFGAGGFGRETAVMLRQINQHAPAWKVIGFFDDGLQKNAEVDGLRVLGNSKDLNIHSDDLSVCLAVADPAIRLDLINRISNPKIKFPTLVHPQANLGDAQRNKLGKGCILTAGVILTTGIEIGDFGIINLATTIGHDAGLGQYCTVMPGCSISGNVSIGKGCVLGTGSRIIQGITIGANCRIGAGSVVTKNFGSDLKIVGVPARGMKLT